MRTKTDQKGQLRGIVLDVDGTLLDPWHRLSPATVAAVARARAAGMAILLASGRSPRAMARVLAALALDGPAVGFNGAVTFRIAGGAIAPLTGTTVDRGAATAVLALAAAHGVETGWYTLDGWRVAAPGPGADEEGALTGEPPIVAPGLPDGLPDPHKLMCIAITPEQTAALAMLRERLPPAVTGVFSHPRYLEVIAPGVDKAAAVAAACGALGLAPDELAAIGDAENDIGMLRAARIGIAMGNASPAVIAAADRVTGSNDRDGAAHAIDALLG
jgi:Cof subfamily protein (haloacid dehalogenase superfamily)